MSLPSGDCRFHCIRQNVGPSVSNRTSAGRRCYRPTRFPNLIDLRLAKTPVTARGLLKTPPTRALSLGLTSPKVFRLPATHTSQRLRRGGCLTAARPHRGPHAPTTRGRTFRDRLDSVPDFESPELDHSEPCSVCSFLLKACPAVGIFASGPHSKGATTTHCTTAGFWRDAWTWIALLQLQIIPSRSIISLNIL
jgi:hypothetical protein